MRDKLSFMHDLKGKICLVCVLKAEDRVTVDAEDKVLQSFKDHVVAVIPKVRKVSLDIF